MGTRPSGRRAPKAADFLKGDVHWKWHTRSCKDPRTEGMSFAWLRKQRFAEQAHRITITMFSPDEVILHMGPLVGSVVISTRYGTFLDQIGSQNRLRMSSRSPGQHSKCWLCKSFERKSGPGQWARGNEVHIRQYSIAGRSPPTTTVP